jgi:hypothetical protein
MYDLYDWTAHFHQTQPRGSMWPALLAHMAQEI